MTALGKVMTGFIIMGRRFGSERVAGLRRNTQCTRIEPTAWHGSSAVPPLVLCVSAFRKARTSEKPFSSTIPPPRNSCDKRASALGTGRVAGIPLSDIGDMFPRRGRGTVFEPRQLVLDPGHFSSREHDCAEPLDIIGKPRCHHVGRQYRFQFCLPNEEHDGMDPAMIHLQVFR